MGLADSESGLSLFQPWTKKCENDFFLPGNSRGLTGGEESHFRAGLKPAFLLPAGKEKWNRGAVSRPSHRWALGVGDPGSNLGSQPQTRPGMGGQQAKTRGRDSMGTDTQKVM